MAGRRKKDQISKDLTDGSKHANVAVHIPAEAPPLPEYFKEFPSLCQVWIEVVTDMARLNILSVTDSGTVEGYCITLHAMRNLTPKVLRAGYSIECKTKTGTRVFRNPDVDSLNDVIKQLKGFAIELGATPASRGKVPSLLQGDLFGRGKDNKNAWNGFN